MKFKQVICSLICLSLIFFISPKTFAISGGGVGGDRNGSMSFIDWNGMTDDERYYTARRGALDKGYNWTLNYNDYNTNKNGVKDFIRTNGFCFTWSQEECDIYLNTHYNYPGFMGIPSGDYVYKDDFVNRGVIDDGSEGYNSYNDAVDSAVSDTKKEEFYSTVSHSNPTTMNLGNGYSIKVEMIVDVNLSPVHYNTYQTVYFNGNQISYDLKHTTSGFRGTENVYAYDFWVTRSDSSPYTYMMNFRYYYYDTLGAVRDTNGAYQLDATLFDFVPSGSNPVNIYPSYVGSSTSNTPFVPVDGSDQTSVNEQIQTQNNEIIEWLKKIYGEELNIKGVINNLFNPLNNLYSVMNNCYNVIYSILGKLDNLTVKLKDWNGDEFKIELGDLELGDLNVDFDVVYNITGITKVTSPQGMISKLPTYKQQLESKMGLNNLKASINNFSTGIFGYPMFNQNGNINNVVPSFSASKPHLIITFLGHTYDLWEYIPEQADLEPVKDIFSFFIYLSTALTIFKYIPELIGNVAGVRTHTEMVEHFKEESEFNEFQRSHFGFNNEFQNAYKGRWI